jgi:Na+/proline symporter
VTAPTVGTGLVTLDWVVIGIYLVIAIGAGVLISRRARGSMENFFLSGRNLPWWLAGTSMVATSFASDTPLVITGWTRASGIAGNWRWWSYVVGTLLVVVVFSRLWRRSEVLTDVEFMELRYSGRPARALRAAKGLYQVVFLHCFVMGWVILGMTKVLVVLFGLSDDPVFSVGPLHFTPAWLSMLGCVIVAMIYSEVAGLWGVVVTDFVQFLLALTGAIALMWVVADAFGGVSGIIEALSADPALAGKLQTIPSPPDGDWSSPSGWGLEIWEPLIFMAVLWFASKNADGSGVMVQRILACKDEKHSVLATLWYAIAHYAVRPWPWIVVALASLLVLPDLRVTTPVSGVVVDINSERIWVAPDGPTPGSAGGSFATTISLKMGDDPEWQPQAVVSLGDHVEAGSLVAATDDEAAYPAMMRRYLPAGLLGLLVASFIAAFMSTIDTHVNLASAYLVNDIYRRFLRPDREPGHYVRIARFLGPLVMVLALVFAASSDSVRKMFDIFTALFAGVGPVYLLRWCWWRINAWSEIAALATSATATLTLAQWPGLAGHVLPAAFMVNGEPAFVGTLLVVVAASILVTIPVTLLTRPVDPGHLAAFFAKVRPIGAWGPVKRPAGHVAPAGGWWVRLVVAWMGGIAMLFGAIFLPGSLFLGQPARALPWLAVTLVGLVVLWRALPGLGQRHQPRQP